MDLILIKKKKKEKFLGCHGCACIFEKHEVVNFMYNTGFLILKLHEILHVSIDDLI